MRKVLWVRLVFFQLQKRKGTTRGGKKKCLMVERTLLTKESHGSLASSQRSHERCCHSSQRSLNHVLPATRPATGHLAPRGPQLSSAKPRSTAPVVAVWLPRQEEALSETMPVTLVRGALPLPSPQGCTGRGGEAGKSDAMFQMRRNHAISAACGRKRVAESNDVALTPHFPLQSAVAAFALLPLPYLQAVPAFLLPY